MCYTTIGCLYIVLINFTKKDSSELLLQVAEYQLERYFTLDCCSECNKPEPVAVTIATDLAFCNRKFVYDCVNPSKYPSAQQIVQRISNLGYSFPSKDLSFDLQIVEAKPLFQ